MKNSYCCLYIIIVIFTENKALLYILSQVKYNVSVFLQTLYNPQNHSVMNWLSYSSEIITRNLLRTRLKSSFTANKDVKSFQESSLGNKFVKSSSFTAL